MCFVYFSSSNQTSNSSSEPSRKGKPITTRSYGVIYVLISKDETTVSRVWIHEKGNEAKILREKLLSVRRNSQAKVTNRGVSSSKPATGNKPQEATISGWGNNVYNINYYGSDYATANAGASTAMDPSAFTKPVADVLSGPALKSPTVEECGYSDRIVQLTMGNSTITTQEAANAVVAYGEWPDYVDGLGEAVDKSTQPGPAVDRFYTLDSASWTTTYKGTCYRLPGCLADMGMFGQNLRYHYLMRSGFLVHVQANATKFHQGMLMVVAIPECEFEEADVNGLTDVYSIGDAWKAQYPPWQLTLFPHQFINLRTNNSATLVLPYVNACPMENAASHNYWTVAIFPVTDLQYTAGATVAVPITVSIAPMYTQFNGLRAPITTQGVMTAHTPGSGQFITTIHNSGFPVYPEFEATHGQHIPGQVVNLLQVARVDTMINFGTATTPQTQLQIQTTQAAGSQVFNWRLDLAEDWCSTTYLARLAKWFVNYRGSMKITLTFCGSAMQTGKYILCYTPPGTAAPTTRKEAMLGTHVVWDIGLQSSVCLVVPWISQTQYRYTSVDNKLAFAGYVSMWCQTALITAPGNPTSARVVGFLSATEDFQFRIPTDNAYYQGLGDEVGKVLNSIENKIENVKQMNPDHNKAEAVTTGESAALTATETGATGGAEAALLMETRLTAPSFSGMSSDVTNFFSKYALLLESTANMYVPSNAQNMTYGRAILVPLSLQDLQVTRALRTKFEMFTYVRFALDVVIMVEVHTFLDTAEDQIKSHPNPFQFQALYCPPGLATPSLDLNTAEQGDPKWFMPTTPS